MQVRSLIPDDVPDLWRVNEEGVPGVGRVTETEMAALLALTHLALGVFEGDELCGFVLCLRPGTSYGSLNYAWFHARYAEFLYVDRVAVSQTSRNRGIGTLLYQRVMEHAARPAWPVVAEVNFDPPNPGSLRFHERNGFVEVGQLQHAYGVVSMLLRPDSAPASTG